MSEARALQATEKVRDLVANPGRWGLQPRAGLEPLDVQVIYEHKQRKTTGAFRIIATMHLSLDGSGQPPFTRATALVAQGHTEAEALEVFYNWMADDKAVMLFTESVKAHNLDVLAKQALEDKKADEAAAVERARSLDAKWVERKTDQLARKFGIKDKKVQLG